MEEKCMKCGDDMEGGSTFSKWGKDYAFCKFCIHVVTNLQHTLPTECFLEDRCDLDPITKNMIEARQRRSRGELIWN